MGKARLITAIISFFMILLVCRLFIVDDAFATRAEFDAAKKMEQTEKTKDVSAGIARPRVEYKAGDLRDPFQGAVVEDKASGEERQSSEAAQKTPPSLTVQGIIWGGKFPQAIINNKVVRVGDTIEGVSVVSIDKEGITIFFGGAQYNLLAPVAGAVPRKEY